MLPKLWFYPAGLLLGLLAGCASVPDDWGRADADKAVAANGRVVPRTDDARAFTHQALRAPLSAETAVQLALLNSPQMRQASARLGFAAADLYEAGRLANPTLSLTRLSAGDSAAAQLTLDVAFNFINLLFLPANTRLAKEQFEAAKLDMASAALDLASDVDAAWYAAVGAQQLMQMRDASARAQQASATLAQRYFDAGNISARELAIERAAASEATLAALSARASATEARSALARLMGLSADEDQWTLAALLPAPPAQQLLLPELQQLALNSRLDVIALRKNAQALADRYGLVRQTRFVDALQIGVERERDFDEAIHIGPTLSLELPLFNWGGGRMAAAQAALQRTEAELDARVLDVGHDVRLAAADLATYKAMADEYRDTLIPSREAAVARAQEQQNYMLIGVFELIVARQQEYDGYAGYIAAVRDYWIARARLARAVGRTLPDAPPSDDPPLDAGARLEAKPASGGHAHHHADGGHMNGMSAEDMQYLQMDMPEMNHDAASHQTHGDTP